jgi:hypothetical protein
MQVNCQGLQFTVHSSGFKVQGSGVEAFFTGGGKTIIHLVEPDVLKPLLNFAAIRPSQLTFPTPAVLAIIASMDIFSKTRNYPGEFQ